MISYEQQPAGMFKHISVSVQNAKPGKMPSIDAFKLICHEFGMVEKPDRIWLEEFEPGEFAVNAIQLVSEMEAGHG